jgi:segregation and condensation protein B
MSQEKLKNIIEAAVFAADRPLAVDDLLALFEGSDWTPERKAIREALATLTEDWQERGVELKEVSSGFRFQVRKEYSGWLGSLWSERPPRYTRALLETLALIAYRQPITRGEIEDVRGVSVSPTIIKTLTDREWIRALGHRDVPGRPEIFGTTHQFLESFNLKTLDELPPLSEVRDIESFSDDLFAAVPLMAVVDGGQTEITEAQSDAAGEPLSEVDDNASHARDEPATSIVKAQNDDAGEQPSEIEDDASRASSEPATSGAN